MENQTEKNTEAVAVSSETAETAETTKNTAENQQDIVEGKKAELDKIRKAVKKGLPPVHANCFDKVKGTDLIRAVDTWNWNEKPVLLISGKSGCGKGMAACWAYKNWVKSFITEDSWKKSAKQEWLENMARNSLTWIHSYLIDFEQSRLQDALSADFLVIDDVYFGDSKPWTASCLNCIITVRSEQLLPTVITVQSDLPVISEGFERRTAERLKRVAMTVFGSYQSQTKNKQNN